MAKFLANENIPAVAVAAAHSAGHDVLSVTQFGYGASDDDVLQLSIKEGRVLVTFDLDFGELVFKRGRKASSGVILLRQRTQSPEEISDFFTAVLAQPIDWEHNFCVALDDRIRTRPLPGDTP